MKSQKITNILLAIIAINLSFISFLQIVPEASAQGYDTSILKAQPVYLVTMPNKKGISYPLETTATWGENDVLRRNGKGTPKLIVSSDQE